MRGGNLPQYLKSLLDPENSMGRIPDPSTYKSAVFQVVENFDLTTASDGSVGFVISPTPVTPTSTGYAHAKVSTNTEASGAQGVWLTQTDLVAASSSSVAANFLNFRPVSGCVCVEYTGDTSTDAGTICCVPIFRTERCPISFSAATTLAYNQQFPLRNGCRMLYRPLDNSDLEYTGGGDAANPASSLASISYGLVSTVTPPVNSNPVGDHSPVALCVMISGATVSKKVARARCVINYEAIPIAASLGLFETQHSPSSPSVLASAMNMAAELPWGEAWQGIAGTAARVGSEMAQSAFASASSAAGLALLNRVKSRGGWRGNGGMGAIGWTDPLGLD